MGNQYLEMKVNELGTQVCRLERMVDGLIQTVSRLEQGIAMKADVTHVREMIKQSEVVIKKIDDRDAIKTVSKVGIVLDGKVMAESIAEQTQDSIKSSLISKGVR